jgi:hypothetical protein
VRLKHNYLGGSGLGLFGWVGDAGGTFGLVFGVFAGFEAGGAGTSGDEFGTDGDVGGGGVCCVQPTAMALNAMAAIVDLVRFMVALLYKID